ncbi:VWA domain-containing protein [Nocardioides sp. JQ2195]|uniref:vWA domain-containing protein n=1 Tax=Nocardioides sp. JQ2195 TaxID=2592334 RepID=UPI00143EAC69|nr:VWA domain-containing protein [Nocardioides sp. JQ2195]QIX27211.1 VWA domain-containing protein [Nocardioides sp. JQ2195]
MALLAFGLLLGLALIPLTSSAEESSTGGTGAVQRFGSCLTSGGQGSLLLLMDTSASLQQTDPDGQRVEAATYLLQELSAFAEETGAELDVAVAGFADSFDVSLDWTPLDRDSTGQVLDAVADYSSRDDGWETDYWMGLNGARKHLADRVETGDCAALVWLSDGMYDLDTRRSDSEKSSYGKTKPYGPDVELTTKSAEKKLEQAGEEDICRAGGVADALRVQGVTTLAIGLARDQDASAFDLMSGIATGARAGDARCGKRDATNLGEFVLAQQIGDLFFAFDELSNPNNAPISTSTPLCQGSPCVEGTHQFVLDASISSVRILGGAGIDSYQALLISPGGERVQIDPGGKITKTFGAFGVEGTWVSSAVFSLTIDRKKDKGWAGEWRLVFIDPESTGNGTARSNIRLYGDLRPAWVDAKSQKLVAGEETQIQLGLERVDRTVVSPQSLAGKAVVDAQLELSDGSTLPIVEGLTADELGKPVALDLAGAPSGSAKVRLVLSLTTAPAGQTPGTTLEPQAVEYPVTIEPPPAYPVVASTLDFGGNDSADPVEADLSLGGSGCAWLGKQETLTLPEGVKEAPVTSEANDENTCATDSLQVVLTPDSVGSGLVSGTLRVMTVPEDGGAPIPVVVNYTYEMERPADAKILWVTFGLLLFAGLLIPLLILALVKWWTAKIPGTGLSWYVVSGHVSDGSSFLTRHIPDTSRVTRYSLEGQDRRRVRISDRTTLQTKPYMRGVASPGRTVVTNAPSVFSTGTHGPLAVQGTWVAVLDPLDPAHGVVELVALMSPTADSLERLLSDARDNMPSAVEELRSKLGAKPRRQQDEDDWGATPSADRSQPSDPSDDW